MDPTHSPLVQVVFPIPQSGAFDYLTNSPSPAIGSRVEVPFGKQQRVGVVVKYLSRSALPAQKLKAITQVLDPRPLLPPDLVRLLTWAADYYHHALGSVLFTALPQALRQGQLTPPTGIVHWFLTDSLPDPNHFKRAPRQWHALQCLQQTSNAEQLAALGVKPHTLRVLQTKGMVQSRVLETKTSFDPTCQPPTPLPLNTHQKEALSAITANDDTFKPWLLYGVTGSGKTEVYLQLIEKKLSMGKQCLVLVPEIGLTPQTLSRFQERLQIPIGVIHSGLKESARLQAWLAAKEQTTPLLLGTRSAVFTPMPKLGLIIIDEEHDVSFKQQDKFRYSARDLAMVRAQQKNIPIVLGSATPSLESWHHATRGHYHLLTLPQRAGSGNQPRCQLIDLRVHRDKEGISMPMLKAIRETIEHKQQVLLFLNRRGFAPVVFCPCGFAAKCERCHIHLVLHQQDRCLRCHHCTYQRSFNTTCPDCGQSTLLSFGVGTQRLEAYLKEQLPDTPLIRIDKDSTRRRGELHRKLNTIHQGKPAVLIGTQMLAKGHHFPQVTLVGILGIDHSLFSHDFRALERLGQLLVQVSGRAGREHLPGQVLLQSHHPEHPALQQWLNEDYHHFLRSQITQRQKAQLPPFSHLALFRAEAASMEKALEGLLQIKTLLSQNLNDQDVALLGPVPSPMEKRQNRFRAQLLLQSPHRAKLQQLLKATDFHHFRHRHLRWSLDVDPLELS